MGQAVVFFVTCNSHKVEEVRYLMRKHSLDVKQLKVKKLEVQAETVEEIAKNSALQALRDYNKPVFVEDTGLFIDALNGFPGPYAAYANKTIGMVGILQLLRGVNERKATFRSAVAFCDLNEKVTCFIGECLGHISTEERGCSGFGFDPIFKPYDGSGKTFAEMNLEEKTTISHRSRAIRKFADWYVNHLNSCSL